VNLSYMKTKLVEHYCWNVTTVLFNPMNGHTSKLVVRQHKSLYLTVASQNTEIAPIALVAHGTCTLWYS